MIEQEIRSLGGAVPRSEQDAQSLLQQIPDTNESLADLQQQLTEHRQQTLSVQSQVGATLETVEELRKQQQHLQDVRQTKGWENIDEKIRDDEENIARMHSEITTAAGEEGLSLVLAPVHDAENTTSSTTAIAPLDTQLRFEVEDAIKATGQEIASIDSKREELPELVLQLKDHQEILDSLLTSKLALTKHHD